MVRAIIAWSLHNQLIVILGILGLIAAGVHSALNLNVEAYPDPTPPLVEVITQNPGASPEEMERLVGIPLETALNGMPGLEDLRSTSIAGLNDIKCQFKYGTDYLAARQEVLNRLAAVSNLPSGVNPRLSPWSPTGEIVRYVLEGPGYTPNQLKAVQDWVLNRAFKQVPGVIDVTGFGGTVKQYQVLLDTRRMRQYSVTMQQVEDAIQKSNANVGGDLLTLGSQAHVIRGLGLIGRGIDSLDPANVADAASIEAQKLDDINNVVVKSTNGVPIYVRQVAKAIVKHQPRLGRVGRHEKGNPEATREHLDRLAETASSAGPREPGKSALLRSTDAAKWRLRRADYAGADRELDHFQVALDSTGADPESLQSIRQSWTEAKRLVGKLAYPEDNVDDDVVEGIVLMRKYEKSLPTSKLVQQKIDEINGGELLPKGMRIVPFNRRTDLVNVTTHNVLHNLLLGMGLVVAVLFVFLGDLASAGIVALVIPMALLFAIAVLYMQGMSANLLSIGAVDFGIIVDSSVIIVENIYRHVTARHADRSRPLIDRIAEASNEIERPLFFSTTIIICAFLPLFAMTGPEGALFGPMAKTYAFAIFGALCLALTMAPMLCSFLFQNKKEEKDTIIDRVMKKVYLRALNGVLNHRRLFLLLVVGLLGLTAVLVPTLGGEFMPELEEGNLWIRAILPRTVSLEEASRMAPRLREVIATVPEVKGVMSHVGRPDDGTDVTSFFNLEFNVPLRPMEDWRKVNGKTITREQIQDELMAKFREFPGIDFNFSQLIRDNVEEALSGVKGANSVKLFGNDLRGLESVAQRVAATLRTVPGIENVGLFHIVGQPNLEIRIRRSACARYGINVADVEAVIQVAIGGKAFSQMVEGEKFYDIVLRLPTDLRDDPDVIGRIPVDMPGTEDKPGARIPLSELAEIAPHNPGASYIYRENNRRYIPIKFSVRGRDLASAINEARAKVDHPADGRRILPTGYRIEWSGEFEQMQEANKRLMWMIPLSIGLIMVLLYTAFKSIKDAILVMANVVTATMGGVWALKLTGTNFSISAAVGFISIFGVAVQNGVLLISYFNQMRGSGVPVREAVMRGAELRLRPVVMTSLTAILGLFPAALATSIGSQAQRPLAIVVVGGMLVALLLTQYLMPVLYSFFPAPAGRGGQMESLSEGSHYTDEILRRAGDGWAHSLG
jgi:cobalt-zinc-cadmium resistance protein CzcA